MKALFLAVLLTASSGSAAEDSPVALRVKQALLVLPDDTELAVSGGLYLDEPTARFTAGYIRWLEVDKAQREAQLAAQQWATVKWVAVALGAGVVVGYVGAKVVR